MNSQCQVSQKRLQTPHNSLQGTMLSSCLGVAWESKSRCAHLCSPQFDGPVKWRCDKQVWEVDWAHCHVAVNSCHRPLVAFEDFPYAGFAAWRPHKTRVSVTFTNRWLLLRKKKKVCLCMITSPLFNTGINHQIWNSLSQLCWEK